MVEADDKGMWECEKGRMDGRRMDGEKGVVAEGAKGLRNEAEVPMPKQLVGCAWPMN
jgi:hypothetical protein